MPQHDMILNNASGAAFRGDLNDALAALGSMMKGPNAPPAPIAGMMWLDDDTPSATVWTVKQYDGADWIEWGRLDIINNAFIPSEGVIAWADVASAATVDLGAQASRSLRLTGTTTISSFGTAPSGLRRRLRIATGLTITHNATSLICPGAANLVLAAGDVLEVESLGSGNWVVVDFQPISGNVRGGLITASGLTIETASLLGRYDAGTGAIQRVGLGNTAPAVSLGINRGPSAVCANLASVDFLSIPAGVRRLSLGLDNVRSNGTSPIIVQIGNGAFNGGSCKAAREGASSIATSFLTAGAAGININASTNIVNGVIELISYDDNLWQSLGGGVIENSSAGWSTAGRTFFSGPPDRLRLTTVSGTNLFTDGFARLSWSF